MEVVMDKNGQHGGVLAIGKSRAMMVRRSV